MKKKEKGFTLIEILAVIIILGVLMIIAVPSVTSYISDSRKKIYISSAKAYIREVQKKMNAGEYKFTDDDTTYYVNINDISLESGGESPYGAWKQAFVIVTYIPDDTWEYYWASVDSAGMKVDVTKYEDLDIDDIYQSSKLYINEQAPAGTRNNIEIHESGGDVTKTTQKIIAEREKVDECYSYKLNESSKTAITEIRRAAFPARAGRGRRKGDTAAARGAGRALRLRGNAPRLRALHRARWRCSWFARWCRSRAW